MFYGITDLATFVVGTIFIVLLPGPNSLYVMTVAAQAGVPAGWRGAAGIVVGDTLLMILAATGAASLLQTLPALFLLFKLAGAAYLAWVGVGLLRSGWTLWRRGSGLAATAADETDDIRFEIGPAPDAALPAKSPFVTALVISLMNPKAILFFVSFFIQFVDPTYPHPVLSFGILGLIVQFFSVLYLSLLIVGGAHLAARFRCHPRLAALSMSGMGTMFIGFGLKLTNAQLG